MSMGRFIYKHRRGTTEQWENSNVILYEGEIGVEKSSDGYTRFKIGDGVSKYNQLPYIINSGSESNTLGKIFTSYPTEEQILALSNNSYFTVISTGATSESGMVTCFVTTDWRANSVCYTKADDQKVYVCPVSRPGKEVYITDFGIRPTLGGSDSAVVAEANSNIIDKLYLAYGATIKFPAGHFWFDRPIDWNVANTQYHIIGSNCTTHTNDQMYGGTWLHFYNLSDGDIALKTCQGTIKDINIVGSATDYNCVVNRENAKNAETINETFVETITAKAYGLYVTGGSMVENVTIINFYYGMYCPTSNTFLTNISLQKCHYGLILENDCKAFNISGSRVMVLVQCNGSLASVTGCRGDSIGEHLVEVINGNNLSLFDLDADFCMGSIVCIGSNTIENPRAIKNLTIHNIHGRHAVKHVYASDGTPVIVEDITNETVADYGVISIINNFTLDSAIITTGQAQGVSPFDGEDNWQCPTLLLTAQSGTYVKNIQIITSLNADNLIEWCSSVIKSFDTRANACKVRLYTGIGPVTYSLSNGLVDTYTDTVDIDLSGYIKTVNGIEPDEMGNVSIVETEPEVADSLESLREIGDTNKKYVIYDADGNSTVYSYQINKVIPKGSLLAEDFPNSWDNPSTSEVDIEYITGDPNPDNAPLIKDYTYEVNSGGYIENRVLISLQSILPSDDFKHNWLILPVTTDQAGYSVVQNMVPYVTGLIPVKPYDTVEINNWGCLTKVGQGFPTMVFYQKGGLKTALYANPCSLDSSPYSIFNRIPNSVKKDSDGNEIKDSDGNAIKGRYTEIKSNNSSNFSTLTNITFYVDEHMVDKGLSNVAYLAFVFYANPNIGLPALGDLTIVVNGEDRYAVETIYQRDWLPEKSATLEKLSELERRINQLETAISNLTDTNI